MQTLTFVRFCINPEVQERLEEEAKELLGHGTDSGERSAHAVNRSPCFYVQAST